jgi:hypothetical protein
MSGKSLKGLGTALVIVSLTAATTTRADVTMESRFTVTGSGILAAGNMSGRSTTIISGDRLRVDSDTELNSGVLRAFTRGSMGPSAQIVRLDDDRILNLDMKRRQYTEQTFEELRAEMQKAAQKRRAGNPETLQRHPPPSTNPNANGWTPRRR